MVGRTAERDPDLPDPIPKGPKSRRNPAEVPAAQPVAAQGAQRLRNNRATPPRPACGFCKKYNCAHTSKKTVGQPAINAPSQGL